MDNGGRNTPTADQSQKESTISLTASSMINASDMVTAEGYQANLRRIQEVKEMVRKLEMNNEAAHKNFLIDQLKKRAEDGREAEDMLARLRNRPEITETVQFTTNIPSDKSEVILPTTATLVEVPESHPPLSCSSPVPTTTYHPPQTVHQGRLAKFQRSLPPDVHQVQSYHPDALRYYVPPHTARQPYSAAPLLQAPVDAGQISRYTTQNVPPQPSVHSPLAYQTGFQPRQVPQLSQPWSSYPPQVIALPAVDTVPVPGYYASPAGWVRTAPAQGGSSTGSSNPTYHEPGFPTPPPVLLPPVTTHNQSQSLSSLAPTSQVQMPLQGVFSVPVTPSAQPPSIRSHPKPAESQSQPVSRAVSKPVVISELPRPHKRPHQPQQQPQQPQRLPQPPLQPQQHSQQSQTLHQQQAQRPPQPLLQLQQHPQQPQTQPQRLPQLMQQPQQHPQQSQARPPQTHPHLPSQSADRPRSTGAPQPSQPTNVQEQAQQQGPQSRTDQAMFIKLFQVAIQRDILQFKAFWFQAKATGISDEWFIAAIKSVPRDLWQSVISRANQSEPTVNAPPTASALQQQGSPIPSTNMPVVGAQLPPIVLPLVHPTPAVQQATKPSVSTEGRTTYLSPGQTSAQYASQLQYYAGQATKSVLSAQVASTSTTPSENIAPTQTVLATPKRDAPQVRANVKTPKDANKSTLAKDILRSLGKIIPKPHQGTGGEPPDQANNRGGDQPCEVTASQPVSRAASPKPPAVPPATSIVDANSPSIPSTKPNVQHGSQRVTSPGPSTVLKEEHRQAAVVDGPIMIDLTLEDSDESVDGKGQEPTFSIQTFATAATPLQPAAATNTTNHTPLLESLSLEESPVEVAADGHNADVRTHSPPLSFAAEDNMESELLYPPPVSAEPVSPSFEPPPREASEHPLDGKLPLFLPSPPISPAHSKTPETDLEMIVDESESRPSLKRRSVDVDEMEIDTKLETPRVSKRRKQQVYVLIPPAPLYVKKAKLKGRAMREDIDLDLDGVGEDEEFQYSHLEQLLIEESKSRLLERRCRWSNCGAILNCTANLLAHIKNHAREEDLQAPFLCRWASCQRQFGVEQERDVHLERHTIRPLPCPFAGCDEQFDKPVEVMQHEVQHQKVDLREPLIHKPTCQPTVPAIPARLGPPPHRLPSHCVIPRRVLKCRISADRHAIVGPWVLWNIWSPVDLNMRKQNASMRGRPTRQVIDYDTDSSDPRRDDYDFLLALSSYPAKNPQLDDLDSTLITMSAARGLTLWGTGSTVNSAVGSATPEEHTNAVSIALAVDAVVPSSTAEETRVEGNAEGTEVTPAARGDSIPEERPSVQSMGVGEEDAVERMLIL